MTDNEIQLAKRCSLIEQEVSRIYSDFSPLQQEFPALQRELSRLRRRSREHENGTFITLVVGPAKSGKSTLVNLLAGAYVSPTDFLECTVRPSIISKHPDGESDSLTCYTSSGTGASVDKIDFILDIVRGFESEEALEGVTVEHLPLTPETVREKVQLGLTDSLSSQALMTSLRVPGGKFLQDRVFIIDMPGFDGAYKNLDDPVYETIARRADLIIFVQSSNAAFSKVSKEFLQVLARTNNNVPVAVVHNVFDAAWWRPEIQKKETAETQLDFAVKEINKMGFCNISLATYLNLGKASDALNDMYASLPELQQSYMRFQGIEDELFGNIISRRDALRLENCLSRTVRQARILEDSLDSILLGRREKSAMYDKAASVLASSVPALVEAPEIFADIESIQKIVEYCCASFKQGIFPDVRKSKKDIVKMLRDMVSDVENNLSASQARIFGLDTVVTKMYNSYLASLAACNSVLAGFGVSMKPAFEAPLRLKANVPFILSDAIEYDNIVPSRMDPRHPIAPHTGSDIHAYANHISDLLARAPFADMSDISSGIVARTALTPVQQSLQAEVNDMATTYTKSLSDEYGRLTEEILSGMIPDRAAFDMTTGRLEKLAAEIRQLL